MKNIMLLRMAKNGHLNCCENAGNSHYSRLALFLVLLSASPIGLTACNAIKIDGPPVRASYSPELATSRIAGDHNVIVRSYEMVSGKEKEIGGAQCVMRSNEFSAAFTTPAQVIVPSFVQSDQFVDGGRPGTLNIECERGAQTGINSLAPVSPERKNSLDVRSSPTVTYSSTGQATHSSNSTFVTEISSANQSTMPYYYSPQVKIIMR